MEWGSGCVTQRAPWVDIECVIAKFPHARRSEVGNIRL